MTNYLPLSLQWDEVKAWHASVCERCDAAISECSAVLKKLRKDGQKTESLHPHDILKSLLENDSTCHFFGTPGSKSIILPDGTDFPSYIQRQHWGRRMYCYAKELRRGFEHWKIVEHSSGVLRRLETLQLLEDRFATEFKGSIPPVENFKEAMRHCPDPRVFADFTLSHVDPTLHSSLIYLNRAELNKSGDLLDFLFGNVRTFLTRLMVANTDVGMKPPVVDDAHLWWGHYELLKREGEKYSVEKESGYYMAAKVCHRLIYKDSRFFTYPKRDVAIQEIPPDVYGAKRTHLLIMMYGIKIAMLMPTDVYPDLPTLLSKCMIQHFELLKDFDLASMYHLGLALQTSSSAMLYYKTFIENGADTKKQMIDKKGRSVSADKETTKKHANSEPNTKVWLLDNGVFLIEFPDGRTKKIAMDVDSNFIMIVDALINHHGAAMKGQLTELTGVNDPGRCLKRTLDNPAYQALRPHVELPGKKGEGGYKTTIKKKQDAESE
jgi:hypothetical protein